VAIRLSQKTISVNDKRFENKMDHGTNYIKIRTALALNLSFDLTSNGVGFSQAFKDKLTDYEEQFRSQIMIPINEIVGLHNWAILFSEVPQSPPKFFCDIYTDDKNHYSNVVAIVTNRIRDVEFYFFYKGTVNDYIKD
jgi:hypothetical protein